MFSLWITQRSHLFVIEKMAQLIDFEQIWTHFYLDLNVLWTEEERRHITSWLTCQSRLPWSSRKQAICVLTQKWGDKEWNDIFINSAWDICFQPLGRKDGLGFFPASLCSRHWQDTAPALSSGSSSNEGRGRLSKFSEASAIKQWKLSLPSSHLSPSQPQCAI